MLAWIVLKNDELRAGRYAEARGLYEESFPELLNEGDPKIDGNVTGRQQSISRWSCPKPASRNAQICCWIAASSTSRPFRGSESNGYWIADVQIYALRGEKQKALSTLRQAIDEGWRGMWWYFLKYDPNLESLHDEPEFRRWSPRSKPTWPPS